MKDHTNKVGNVLKKKKKDKTMKFFLLENVLMDYLDLPRSFFFFPNVDKNEH